MSNYYEETMPLETDNDDYLKYYFDESLPLFQKLNTIIKKGEPFQKQALLSKLNLFLSHDLFKSLMNYILDDIETWDRETIFLFPQRLYPLFLSPKEIFLKNFDNELINKILEKFILIISSTDEQISREYMKYFEKIIIYYNKEKINEKKNFFPYKIEKNIYEKIISLSKFDESITNKQLSCCLCSSIIRLINDAKNENVQKLFNRVCFLFGYCDKPIEIQLSRELEFLFPIFKKDLLENSEVLRAVNSYINRDSDFSLQSTAIISIIKNLEFIECNDLFEKLVNKMKEIFEDEANFEKENKNMIFFELIQSLEKNYKKINKAILCKLFEDNFIAEFIKSKEDKIIIENFDKIYFIYEHMLKEVNIYNLNFSQEENKREENENNNNFNIIKLNYDELFFGILNKALNINNINYFYTERKKIYNENENIERKILYINIMKIIPCLSDFKKNKCMYDKFNFLFNRDNIYFALNCYAENFRSSQEVDKNGKKNNILYNLMTFFLKKNMDDLKPSPKSSNPKSISPSKKDLLNSKQENPYIKLFNNILTNILHKFEENKNLFNNNILLFLCDFFQKIIKKIYKYLKPMMNELDNLNINNISLGINNSKIKIKSIDKIYDDIYHLYLTKLIQNEKLGNHIRNELIKIFPYLILYGKNRVVYFKFIQEHFIKSEKYFNRRYSIVFMEKCLQIYSFKMFNKIGLSDFLITLIHDENNSISASVINLIYIYNKKITKNSAMMFKDIIQSLSKINKDNKDNKLVHIEDFDIEKNRNISNILSLDFEKKEPNDKSNEYWTNLENKLMKKEKEIFGNDTNYGFHQTKSLVRSQTLNLNSQSLDIKSINRKNNKESIVIKSKDKITNSKKSFLKEKCFSSIVINTNKSNSKTYLPKIKQNRNSCMNSLSTKIIIRSNIKKINNNYKIRQENQKFNENNNINNFSKNNNSVILSDKPSTKTSYDFAKKGKSETKAVKVSHSIPSFYPELINSSNAINFKNENGYIEPIKIKFGKKNKDMLINTLYKSKNNGMHLEYIYKSNKLGKLKKENFNENNRSGRYNKILEKLNPELEKFNLTNVSHKEKNGQTKWYIK